MFPRAFVPKAVLALGLALWTALGVWAVFAAPFSSGTDESISYVAFAAAKNRWATEEDFHSAGVEHFYYPPLYFLCFAPFYGDDPAFVGGYPRGSIVDANYLSIAGRLTTSAEYAARVPPALDRLYRHARLFSLALGVTVLLCLAATLRLLSSGPSRWWLVLLGTAPLLFLPQFLYYQTLCNNDALVNALSAAATLCFVAALRFLEHGRRRRFTQMSLATALLTGLALLTKMSGFALLPLLFGLAAARALAPAPEPPRLRAGRALLHLATLLGVAIAGGGWWILYKARLGDWDGMKAQLVAHPWAFGPPISLAEADRLLQHLIFMVRSYYAMFGGLLDIGVPDVIFFAFLVVPALWCACLVLSFLRIGRGLLRSGPRPPLRPVRILLWTTLAAVVLLNVLLVLLYLLRGMDAGAYGRLLFPSLVAAHAGFAGLLAPTLSPRPRRAALASLVVTACCGGPFLWTFTARMADAVAQPREDVRVLFDRRSVMIPVEDHRISQRLSVPAGELTGFRIKLVRGNHFPQLGASLEGVLRFRRPDGAWQQAPLRPVALGDFDNCRRWVEIPLASPIGLLEQTEASLHLEAAPAHPVFSFVRFSYVLGGGGEKPEDGAVLDDGTPTDVTLCVAAVYRPPGGGRRGGAAL